MKNQLMSAILLWALTFEKEGSSMNDIKIPKKSQVNAGVKKRDPRFSASLAVALYLEMLCSSIMDGSIHNIEEREKDIDDIVDSLF